MQWDRVEWGGVPLSLETIGPERYGSSWYSDTRCPRQMDTDDWTPSRKLHFQAENMLLILVKTTIESKFDMTKSPLVHWLMFQFEWPTFEILWYLTLVNSSKSIMPVRLYPSVESLTFSFRRLIADGNDRCNDLRHDQMLYIQYDGNSNTLPYFMNFIGHVGCSLAEEEEMCILFGHKRSFKIIFGTKLHFALDKKL